MHGGKRYESSALISALLSVSTSRSGGHTRAPWNTASGPRPGSIRGPSHRHGTSSGQTHPVLHRLRGTGRRGGCTACSGTSGWLEQRRDSGVVERRDLDKDFFFFFFPSLSCWRRPVGMLFNVGETRSTEGDVLGLQPLICGSGRTSLHPPPHTSTLHSPSVILQWKKESGIYTSSQSEIAAR